MKKTRLILTAIACVMAISFSLAGCADKNFMPLGAQSDILTELRSKTADIGILDSIMAENYVGQPTNKDLMIINDLKLTDEKYGIAFRKGSVAFADKVNMALTKLSKDGTMRAIAEKYNVTKALLDFDYTSKWDTFSDADKEDYNYILAKGEIILGYTNFLPIAYMENDGKENEELVGYDIEIAKKVAEELGLKIKYQLIIWDNKILELNTKKIDCIWNGMTITKEITDGCTLSIPYLNNSQVALIRIADKEKYTKDISSFSGAKIVAERGSAGEKVYEDIIKSKINKK